MDHRGGAKGIFATAFGYAMNARPGPVDEKQIINMKTNIERTTSKWRRDVKIRDWLVASNMMSHHLINIKPEILPLLSFDLKNIIFINELADSMMQLLLHYSRSRNK